MPQSLTQKSAGLSRFPVSSVVAKHILKAQPSHFKITFFTICPDKQCKFSREKIQPNKCDHMWMHLYAGREIHISTGSWNNTPKLASCVQYRLSLMQNTGLQREMCIDTYRPVLYSQKIVEFIPQH